jgi:twin BRCT domain
MRSLKTQSVARYRLLPFQSLAISLTWMDDNKHRDTIGQSIVEHGGTFSKDLQISRLTHLLCGGDGDGGTSEKIKIAMKYNEEQAKKAVDAATIHIVWEEWFWDCLEFEGRFGHSIQTSF